jgi:hypothetical protein
MPSPNTRIVLLTATAKVGHIGTRARGFISDRYIAHSNQAAARNRNAYALW